MALQATEAIKKLKGEAEDRIKHSHKPAEQAN